MKKNTFLYTTLFIISTVATTIYPMQCSICLYPIDLEKKDEYTETKCEHFFHDKCINQWVYCERKDSCPNCRKKIIFGKERMRRDRNACCKDTFKLLLCFGSCMGICFLLLFPRWKSLGDEAYSFF